MSLVVMQTGDQAILDNIATNLLSKNYVLHLYVNDHTPVVGDTLSNYTEATFAGYKSGQTMTGFGASTIVSSHAVTTGTTVTWTKTDATTVSAYGVYVTTSDGKTLIYAERDPSAPVNMNANGASYSYTPSFSCISEF